MVHSNEKNTILSCSAEFVVGQNFKYVFIKNFAPICMAGLSLGFPSTFFSFIWCTIYVMYSYMDNYAPFIMCIRTFLRDDCQCLSGSILMIFTIRTFIYVSLWHRHLAVKWDGENGRSHTENIRPSSSTENIIQTRGFGKKLHCIKVILWTLARFWANLRACRHFFNDL